MKGRLIMAKGKSIAYATKRQKEYILSYQKTNLWAQQLKRVNEYKENLELPEASWTLTDLIDSGIDFTYPFMGGIEKKNPDSSFLKGYGALHGLISIYSSLASLAQCIFGDSQKCKNYLYLAAYCQKCICQWPNQEKSHSSTDFVSLSHLGEFYMGIIADADDEFVRNLGELLCLPERNWNNFLTYRGNAAVNLALNNTKDAIYYAEKMKEEVLKENRTSMLWVNYALCIKAIATRDVAMANELICSIVNSWRRTSGPPKLLIIHAIGLAKIAVQQGLEITIDTLDCPQVLIQPAQMDYSDLELPRPRYGFPWEK